MTGIYTDNAQLVGGTGDHVTVRMPRNVMTRREALAHAAWLVALADPLGDEFPAVLEAVQSGG